MEATMKARGVRMIVVIGMGFFVLGLGGLAGLAIERMRFEPQRAAMLEHLEAVIGANQATVIAVAPCARAEALARSAGIGF
jgi:hypothetical protein